MNDHLRTAIVALLMMRCHPAPFQVAVTFKGTGGLVLPDQMRTIDRGPLIKRLGRIDTQTLRAVLDAIGKVFAV